MTADDWASRALELVMTEGPQSLKVSRLCDDLGVTKGSFYWHFSDIDALKGAVAEVWRRQHRSQLNELSTLNALPARERVRAMALLLISDEAWALQRVLRDWARAEQRVADALKASDLFVFEMVQDAIAELDADAQQARMRAGLLVYAGIGFAAGESALPRPTADDIDVMMEWLTG